MAEVAEPGHLCNFTVPMPGIEACWTPEWFVDLDGRVGIIVSLLLGMK
ncbi:hypothetical protein [Nocardia sp. NBC_01009]|nr:hypothetical protein OHA42_14810 [Nocardia sp. NBC_01009]